MLEDRQKSARFVGVGDGELPVTKAGQFLLAHVRRGSTREFPDRFPDGLDLRVDLNTEDDTGLPWAFLSDARDPSLVREGAWLVVGSGKVRAVAQVAEVKGDLVWVRPLPGPVSRYRHLLGDGRIG